MLPLHRSFSSQVEKKASKPPKPPRRPPTPPRKPPSGSRDNEDDDDDERARAATATGRDRLEKSRDLEEQNRKRENERDRIETRRAKEVKDLTDGLHRSQRLLAHLKRSIDGIRDGTLRELHHMYRKGQVQVNDLKNRVEASSKYTDALHDELRLKMEGAAQQGKLDYLSDQHQESTGLADQRRKVDDLTDEIDGSLREMAELKYTIDWTAWHREKTEFQLNEVIEATRKLKVDSGPHAIYRSKADEVARSIQKASRILTRLNENLYKTSHSLSVWEAQIYVKITSQMAHEMRFVADNFMQASHNWRKLDRFALAASRFPELNDHVILETQSMPLLRNLNENVSYITTLISMGQAHKDKPEWRPVSYAPLLESTTAFRRDYLAFLSGGLTWLNPSLDSELGRLKYAALRPFETFFDAGQELGFAMRTSYDFFQDMIEKTQEAQRKRARQSGSFELVEQDGERDRWLQKITTEIDLADMATRQFRRTYMDHYNQYAFQLVTRLVNSSGDESNLNNLKRILSERYERAKIEHNEALAFDGLSKPALYHDHMATNTLMDPIKLRGNDMLYPLKKDYPVEFISLEARVVQVLKELPSDTVVGIDMLGPQEEKGKPAYISIATTEKVLLFDWCWWLDESVSALTKLLENPHILKVVHNIHVMEKYLSEKNICPRGVVSIAKKPLEKHTEVDDQLKSLGRSWKLTGQSYMSWGSLFGFVTDLASLSTYNLLTFLSAATPECISSLRPELKANISQARERMRHRIATTDNSGLVLGPVKWDHVGVFQRLKKAHHVEYSSPDTLKIITRVQAARDLSRILKKRKKEHVKLGSIDRDDLAAYYMFTTFNEELTAISTMLRMEDVAGRILQVSRTLKLTLHPEDAKILKDIVNEPVLTPSKPEFVGFEPVSEPQVTAKEPPKSTDENEKVDGPGNSKLSQDKKPSSGTVRQVSSRTPGTKIRPIPSKTFHKIRHFPSGPSNSKGPKIPLTKPNLKSRPSPLGPSSPKPRMTLSAMLEHRKRRLDPSGKDVDPRNDPADPASRPVASRSIPKDKNYVLPHQDTLHGERSEKSGQPKQNINSRSPSNKVNAKKKKKPSKAATTPLPKTKVTDSEGSSTTDSAGDVEMGPRIRRLCRGREWVKSGTGKKGTMVGTKNE